MSTEANNIRDIHWLMDMYRTIDVGVTAIDRNYNIQTWNNFMQNHSGLNSAEVVGKNIFTSFPEIPQAWFERKIESVLALQNQAYSTWRQRPHLFKFPNYRPISGTSEFMYQNVTFIPLLSADTSISHIGINVFDVTEIAVSELNLEIVNNKLSTLSRTDGLTQLNNRAYWEECLIKEINRNSRSQEPVSLLIFDIDHFKNVNDTYGHTFGDEVLRHTSAILKNNIRDVDIAGRYGGEEFGVILFGADTKGAMVFAERLRQNIEKHTVTSSGHSLNFTISIGIAELTNSIKDHKTWIECADKALYASKEAGRNRTTVFQ
ncbi:MAG: diguanylate cyclase [Gammaproteobacteria bacterium]|nr:diguanylate cyclase [Gammaproteobacteria bacterium]MDH5777197.1 diguanylate cyclase [Gammaproteobacteria bacterium]